MFVCVSSFLYFDPCMLAKYEHMQALLSRSALSQSPGSCACLQNEAGTNWNGLDIKIYKVKRFSA